MSASQEGNMYENLRVADFVASMFAYIGVAFSAGYFLAWIHIALFFLPMIVLPVLMYLRMWLHQETTDRLFRWNRRN